MKKLMLTFFIFLTLSTAYGEALNDQKGMLLTQQDQNLALVERMFAHVYEEKDADKLSDFVSTDFQLVSNGKHIDMSGLRRSLQYAFKRVKKILINKPFIHMMKDVDRVMLHFNMAVYDLHGHCKKTEVIAIFEIKKGKIIKWTELTSPDWTKK